MTPKGMKGQLCCTKIKRKNTHRVIQHLAVSLEKGEGSPGNPLIPSPSHVSLPYPPLLFPIPSSLFLSFCDMHLRFILSRRWVAWSPTRFIWVEWLSCLLLHFIVSFSRNLSSPSFLLFFSFALSCLHRVVRPCTSGVMEAYHPSQRPPFLCHFGVSQLGFFQPCCLIAGWAGLPLLGSNPSPTIIQK